MEDKALAPFMRPSREMIQRAIQHGREELKNVGHRGDQRKRISGKKCVGRAKKKPGPKPKKKAVPEAKPPAKVLPKPSKPKQLKALDSVKIWHHECIPYGVRRPWEVFYEDLHDKEQELPANALKAFKNLPHSQKRRYIDVTVTEMAAFVNFMRTVPESSPEQFDLSRCYEKAAWIKEDGHERSDCIEYFQEHS
jgi:hypothetical protein